MKLSEVFDQLAYGELSQMSLVDETTGLVSPAKYASLVSYANFGLTALYKRFPLKENYVTIGLSPGKLVYQIDSEADTSFIGTNDTEEEFSNDILKIEKVLVSSGAELGLNNAVDPLSCFTPTATILRVPSMIVNKSMDLPDELQTDTLKIVYRANHPPIVKTASFNPSRVELELPASHLEPLVLFMACRATTPLGVGQFEGLAGNNHYAKYEKACQDIEMLNLRVDQGSQNTRLRQAGWV